MSPVEISMKREPESMILSAEVKGGVAPAASSNKRIKTNIAATPGSKRATRASTGAPITLTAKGSLYRAHKDTGDSWDEQELQTSPRAKSELGTAPQPSSAGVILAPSNAETSRDLLPEDLPTQQDCQHDCDSSVPTSATVAESECGKPMEHDHAANGGGGVRPHDNGGGSKEVGRGTGGAAISKVAALPRDGEGEDGGDSNGSGGTTRTSPAEGNDDGPSVPRRRRGRKGRSIYRGVCVTREGKWRAVIYKERKQLYLGVYESELEAAKAHDRAARFHFPDKAMTNFDTEEEANRLLESEEQRRRVQQGVDRDLAPLRRLGALAAASRGIVGYPDSPQTRESVPRSQIAEDGSRTQHINGGTRGGSRDVVADSGRNRVGVPRFRLAPWKGEPDVHRPGLVPAVEEYTGEGGYLVNSSGESGKLGRRSSPCSLAPNESLPTWRQDGNRSSGGDVRDFYKHYQSFSRDRHVEAEDNGIDPISARHMVQVTDDNWRSEVSALASTRQTPPGPGPPRLRGSRGPVSHEPDGSAGSMATGGRGWRINQDSQFRRWSGAQKHDSDLAAVVDDELYRTSQQGARAGCAGGGGVAPSRSRGLFATRSHAMEGSIDRAVAKDDYVGDGASEDWLDRHFSPSEAPSSFRGVYSRYPKPQVIAVLEAKVARARQEDEETAAAAEAAMEMAGYGKKWLNRGLMRTEGSVGSRRGAEGSCSNPKDDDRESYSAHGYVPSRYPRYRQRPNISVRASAGVKGARWDPGNVPRYEYDKDRVDERGPGVEVEAWQRYGREPMCAEPDVGPDRCRERDWRAGGGPREEVYEPGARCVAMNQGPSRAWHASRYEGGSLQDHVDGRGGPHDARPSYSQKRVAAAAAAAAVALKHSYRNPAGGGGNDRLDRFVQAPSQRWPVAAVNGQVAREDSLKTVRASNGLYPGAQNMYPSDRPTREWSEPDKGGAARVARVKQATDGDFLPSRHGQYDIAGLSPEAVAGVRAASSAEGGVSGGLPAPPNGLRPETSFPGFSSDWEKRRPLLRTKRTPHDVCGSSDVDSSPPQEHKPGQTSDSERLAVRVSNGSEPSADNLARRSTSGVPGHYPRQRAPEGAAHGGGKVDGIMDGDGTKEEITEERDDSSGVCVNLHLNMDEVDEKPAPVSRGESWKQSGGGR